MSGGYKCSISIKQNPKTEAKMFFGTLCDNFQLFILGLFTAQTPSITALCGIIRSKCVVIALCIFVLHIERHARELV